MKESTETPSESNPSPGASEGKAGSASDPVTEILDLLGKVVLLPNRALSKKAIGKGWQKRTLRVMDSPAYLQSLVGKNIGVLLGQASGGLCTIDIDVDDDVEPFLSANPKLRGTTRTKRVRGCNIWLYVEGPYPSTTKIKITSEAGTREFGEWRADRNQTLIYGQAIDREKGEKEPTAYKILNRVRPMKVRFAEIRFPVGSNMESAPTPPPPLRLNTASCIAASLHNCVSASLHHNPETVLGNIASRLEGQKALNSKHPHLVGLYTEFIEPRYQALPNARNDFIVQAVPFLYRAVAAPYVLELVGTFYDCNRSLFHDSREQHMKEATAMLESVTKTYSDSLTPNERQIYEALSEHERGAFRICRDLAMLPKQPQAMTFFIGFGHLGSRLGIHGMQAQRIMRQLSIYGLIQLLEKGTRRAAGVEGKAGVYKWLL